MPILAQDSRPIFPGVAWRQATPLSVGWSEARLADAQKYFATLPAANLVVIDHGKLVAQWGDSTQRIKISSMRKSLLSALYGIHVASGDIHLDQTLQQLGIDDDPPLNPQEKLAMVRMLLQARSGVYHSFVAGTPAMRAKMPERGSHPPGTFWYYNNWDFNALGTIFEQQTHSKIGQEFLLRIAQPLQMQDFRLEDMYYLRSQPDSRPFEKSIHPAYHFRLSARDLARFGYLYLRNGQWNSHQILPSGWVQESLQPYSDAGDGAGYGYLWWINDFKLPENSFSAQGALGKYVVVFPGRDLVIVYLNHTEFPDNAASMTPEQLRALPSPTSDQIQTLLQMLLDAQRQPSTKSR